MLYVTSETGAELDWQVGRDTWEMSVVANIWADGEELRHIIDSFNNIPHHKNKKIQFWSGDIAQFIWDNL